MPPAATALVWLAITGPYLDDGTMPLNPRAWVWVFPMLDATLALLAVRRMVHTEAAHRIFAAITLGFLLLGGAHAATAWAAFDGTLELGSALAATTMVGPLVLGVVATLPSLTVVTSATGEPFRGIGCRSSAWSWLLSCRSASWR